MYSARAREFCLLRFDLRLRTSSAIISDTGQFESIVRDVKKLSTTRPLFRGVRYSNFRRRPVRRGDSDLRVPELKIHRDPTMGDGRRRTAFTFGPPRERLGVVLLTFFYFEIEKFNRIPVAKYLCICTHDVQISKW